MPADNSDHKFAGCSRRAFLTTMIGAPVVLRDWQIVRARDEISVASPNGKVQFELHHELEQLSYRVFLNNSPVLETSQLGIVIEGIDLSRGVTVKRVAHYRIHEKYPTRGMHSAALDSCNGARISLSHVSSKTSYVLELRTFDDGVAFRYLVPGNGKRVPDETTSFAVPVGSIVWFHDFEGHYEGIHTKKEIAAVNQGEWAAPPLTIKLPNATGYAAITEAALMNYPGMGLQAGPRNTFNAVLGHALPVSHPFDLRYGKEEAKRLAAPAAIDGEITTPWRVVMAASDLNMLVNCDIISNVSPTPDKKLFPAGLQTPWVKPGRAVWKYLDGGDSTFEGMKEFSRLAGELGFEYNIVEGFWQKWSEDQMRELVDYSRRQKVGVWFWKHSKDLRSPANRENFFALCNRVGVVGAKIDFFDHEAKEIIDLYQALLRSAAEHKIMLEFHGANKPAGESRTWPNEMTREAIRGMEYRSLQTRGVHNTTLPFTRFLAGHADYTPLHFGERRRETSWAHQIATAVIFTSPLLIYGAHPTNILQNPAAELIKSIPSIWDETIVLPVSEIGEIAAFARRSGPRWFLAVMNGGDARTLTIPLSFLGRGNYRALVVGDVTNQADAVRVEDLRSLKISDPLSIELRPAGGFVARIEQR
jgi:alpha-glucosidase